MRNGIWNKCCLRSKGKEKSETEPLLFFPDSVTFSPSAHIMQTPEGMSLYDILELNKEEVEKDNALIKKAYRKLALQYHPDKQPTSSSSNATADTTHQFQLVGYAYSILSDTSKRRLYDSNGNLHGPDLDFFAAASMAPDGKTWTEYFMDLADGVVNEETLEEHALKYKGKVANRKKLLSAPTVR